MKGIKVYYNVVKSSPFSLAEEKEYFGYIPEDYTTEQLIDAWIAIIKVAHRDIHKPDHLISVPISKMEMED